MEGQRFIRTIRLENILSFGPDTPELPLEPLNVFIGPNASGKSNINEALSLLQAAPRDLQEPIRQGGGITDWLWKGASVTPTATVEVTVSYGHGPTPLRYRLSFTKAWDRFELRDEAVENERPTNPHDDQPYFYYRYQEGRPMLNVKGGTPPNRYLRREDVNLEQSILSQRRDSDSYPELFWLTVLFQLIGIYGDWDLGSRSPARLPQQADLPRYSLASDGSNLSLVLNYLLNDQSLREHLLKCMKDFYPAFEDMTTEVNGGAVQTLFHESGLRTPIPATRISDGSLRYLCLLAVLCNSKAPRLITCIEEPEIGLHPDIIPDIARLLIEASKYSQIFVTTHSDILVDALTDVPEAVVVCEKVNGATRMGRLNSEELKSWLQEYRLGELWTRGRFGGNRW